MFQHVLTSRRARATAVVAAMAALASLAPLGASTAVAEEAPLPAVTIPAERRVDPNAGDLPVAGTTGFLRGDYDGGFSWVSYADGSAVPWDHKGANLVYATGSDVIARYYTAARKIVLQDVRGGAEQTIALPAGQTFRHMLGTTVITDEVKDARVVAIHGLSVANGVMTDRRLSGLPAGTTRVSHTGVRGEAGFLVEYERDGVLETGWVDGTLGVVPTPRLSFDSLSTVKLIGDHLYTVATGATTARIWDVDDWSAPRYEIPVPTGATPLAVEGGDLLFTRTETGATTREVVARRLIDGTERVLLAKVLAGPRTAGPDGRLLFVRVDGSTARSVHSVKAGADGTAATAKLYEIPLVRSRTQRIAAAQGVVHTIDDVPWKTARLRSTELSTTGELTAGPRVDRGEHQYAFYNGCQEPTWCPDLLPTGDGRVVFEEINGGGLYVLEEGKQLPAKHFPDVSIDGDLEVSGRYASYSADGQEHQILDIDTGQVVFRRDLGNRATSLEGNKLWVESATQGTVEAIDVRTGNATERRQIADCALKDLQVWGLHLYWKCDHKSGVYYKTQQQNVSLPDHRSALIGDAYVAWEQAGVLYTTDARGGRGTRTIGRPADVRPGRGWTVDRFGGRVTYVDTSGDVQVVATATTSWPSLPWDTDSIVPPSEFDAKGGANTWKARFWVSEPIKRSSLHIYDIKTSTVLRSVAGGATRSRFDVAWDGRDRLGRLLKNGTYRWWVDAEDADGTGLVWFDTGLLTLSGAGLPADRDHAGAYGVVDGQDDLLALTSGGSLDFWHGTGTGRVSGKTAGAGWGTSVNAAVPFGDVNGDNCKDVLVRMSTGELRTYKPGCGKPLTPSVAYTKAGTGFGGMNVLTSPGDLTGDGRADLVARNGDSLYLYAGKAGGTLASGVRFGSGWSPFTHIAGAGDLDGDRIGDLVARKSDGSLYRYSGAGGGRLKAGVKIKSGWGASYTTVVGVGDLDSDAKRDLVVRDRAGLLFRISGDGNGSFGTAVQIGSGWGSFKGLF